MLSPALAEALRQALAARAAAHGRGRQRRRRFGMLALHAAAIAREQGIDLLLFHASRLAGRRRCLE